MLPALFTGLRLGDVVNLRWDEVTSQYAESQNAVKGFIVVKPMAALHQRSGRACVRLTTEASSPIGNRDFRRAPRGL
jgi:hypothetical protein